MTIIFYLPILILIIPFIIGMQLFDYAEKNDIVIIKIYGFLFMLSSVIGGFILTYMTYRYIELIENNQVNHKL